MKNSKTIVLVCNIVAAVGALLAIIALFMTFAKDGDGSAFKFMKEAKDAGASKSVSGLLKMSTYVTLILGIVTLLFAALRIVGGKVDALKMFNTKIFGIVFAVLGFLTLVFGVLYLISAGSPFAGDYKELNETVKAGIGATMALIGGIVAGLGAVGSFVVGDVLDKGTAA